LSLIESGGGQKKKKPKKYKKSKKTSMKTKTTPNKSISRGRWRPPNVMFVSGVFFCLMVDLLGFRVVSSSWSRETHTNLVVGVDARGVAVQYVYDIQ